MSAINPNSVPDRDVHDDPIIPKKIVNTLKGTFALSLIVAPICVKINRLNGRVSLFDVSLQTLSISLLWVSMSQQFPNPIANVCNYFNEKVKITLDYLQAQLASRGFLN